MKIVMLGGTTKEEIEKRLQMVSAAGVLSRADGTVTQVYESRDDYNNNLKLIKNVLNYGHRSIAEHDYIVFALEDVTPIVEQTIIGYRLTSFTIKSRRNVDFRNVGFYLPEFKNDKGEILSNNKDLQDIYLSYMQSLFNKYGDLVDEQLPVEDCRYILPYSYYSNIIMGCDANELLRITSDLLYGKLSKIDELRELGLKFKALIEDNVPYLVNSLEKEKSSELYTDKFDFLDEFVKDNKVKTGSLLPEAQMTNYTENADWIVLCNIIKNRYQVSYEDAAGILAKLSKEDPDLTMNMMHALLHSKNQRELEQVIFSFEMPISLAVLTHITRHRMHSLLVPDFVPMWNLENYVTPNSLKEKHEGEYQEIFANNKTMVDYFKSQGVRDEDLVYFYLSGNACNISTTMNARNLEWLSRMRCCTKAQWEIRNLVKDCVLAVKEVSPLIGTTLGATCTVMGYCPEGKDSCKNRGVVIKKLEKNDSK